MEKATYNDIPEEIRELTEAAAVALYSQGYLDATGEQYDLGWDAGYKRGWTQALEMVIKKAKAFSE